MRFDLWDYGVLVAYFLTTIGLGMWFGREEKDTKDYLLGGRNMPWMAVCLSILATEASAITFIGAPAQSFERNFTYLQFAIGSLIGRILIARLLISAYYRGRVSTVYEYLRQRFGMRTRDAGVIFFFVTRILASGVRLLAISMALSVVADISLVHAIILVAMVALLYTCFGGIKAVIWTDVFQIMVFMGGAVLCIWFILSTLPGGWSGLMESTSGLNKFQVFDFRLTIKDAFVFVAAVTGGCFLTFSALGTDQGLAQRLLTCRKVEQSQRAMILTGIIDFPIVIVFLLIGAGLFSFYKFFPDPNLPERMDYIFPYFMVSHLPSGVRGLLIAGIFAASMSSLDSSLAGLCSSMVVDIYRPYIRPQASERHYLFVSRLFVVLFCILLVAVALICHRTESILVLGFKIGSFTYGSLLGIFLLGVTTRRGVCFSNILAMVTSILVVAAVYVFTSVSWPWYVVIGTLWTYGFSYMFGNSEKRGSGDL
jgi:SSS family solute:Na+ symporter